MTQAKFSPRQARFVEEYCIDWNATQAAIRAGYKKKTAYSQGQRLLKNVEVAAAIQKRKTQLADQCEVTADRIIREYARLAFIDPAQCYDENDNLLPITQMPEAVRRALAGFDLEVKSDGDGYAHVRKIKLSDKKGALDSLARINGMFQDKLHLTGADHLAEEIKAARDRRRQRQAKTAAHSKK